MEGLAQKENARSPTLKNRHVELHPYESTTESDRAGAVNSATMCNTNVLCQISETGINNVEKPSILASEPTLEAENNDGKEPFLSHSKSLSPDDNSTDAFNSIESKPKRMGYKQKQNFLLEKTSTEKLGSTNPIAPKVESDTMVHVTLPSRIVKNEIGTTCDSDLCTNLPAMTESSVNQKKKTSRNGKNKHKVEEPSSSAALPLALSKEVNLSEHFAESDKAKVSVFELDQGSVPPASFSKDPHQQLKQRRYLQNEDSHGGANSQWKPQHSRRMPRNIQANRPAEKSHGSDAVMWAPVKPQNKTEIMDDGSCKIKTEALNSLKVDQQLHNNLKNKRVELERYIPKAVAKETVQQVCIQQVASSTNQTVANDCLERSDSCSQGPQTTQHANSTVGRVGSGVESNGDGRQTKQGKSHGSWRQRGSAEIVRVHDMQDVMKHDPNSDENVQKSTEHKRAHKGEISSCAPDGSNEPSYLNLGAFDSIPVTKDQTATGRRRQIPLRGHKDLGVNPDAEHKKNDGQTEKIGAQIASCAPSQPDVGATLKDNRVGGERLTSHWQPKSQVSNNQLGNRPHDQIDGSEVSQVNKRGSTHHGGLSLAAGRDEEIDGHYAWTHHNQSISSKAGEAPNLKAYEARGERRNAPSKGHPRSSNQVPDSSVVQAPASIDLRHENHPSSGFRKNGNQNHFGRMHERQGDWKSSGQDNRRYNQPPSRERQGQKLHYEYQPVGPYDNGKRDNFERLKDGNHTGGRLWERGQTHTRSGGNFYGRQGGL